MKDAFGGTFMIKVLIVFFVIYISFMTVAIGYAKAFRIKNHIVSILEKPAYSNNFEEAIKEIQGEGSVGYLGEVAYNYPNNDKIMEDCNNRCTGTCSNSNLTLLNEGICIVTKESNGNKYYEVTSYFIIEPPLFSISIVAPIRGETKIINPANYSGD